MFTLIELQKNEVEWPKKEWNEEGSEKESK